MGEWGDGGWEGRRCVNTCNLVRICIYNFFCLMCFSRVGEFVSGFIFF